MKRFRKASDIKVAVLGYGSHFNMGRIHLEHARNAGMTPAAVVDPDAGRLEAAQKEFPGIETYPDVSRLLRSSAVNMAIIITPHNTHASLALRCLRAGMHVICEKPFAITTAECDAMIRTARAGKLFLSAYHNRHWDGSILRAARKIGAGTIGTVVRIEAHAGHWAAPDDWWRTSKTISGGILYDWGVHLLEYAFQIIKDEIVEVSGFASTGYWASSNKWKKDTNEDEASAIVRFRNGAFINLRISSIDNNPKNGALEITGTDGVYIMEGGRWEMHVTRNGVKTITKGRNPPDEWHHYYRNVVDHLVKGSPLVITPEWARRMIHVLDLAGRSARKGAALRTIYS